MKLEPRKKKKTKKKLGSIKIPNPERSKLIPAMVATAFYEKSNIAALNITCTVSDIKACINKCFKMYRNLTMHVV